MDASDFDDELHMPPNKKSAHLSKDYMFAIQPGSVIQCDKELQEKRWN